MSNSDSEYFDTCEGLCDDFSENGALTGRIEGPEKDENDALLSEVLNAELQNNFDICEDSPPIIDDLNDRIKTEELLTEEERQTKLSLANTIKQEGNNLFGNGDFENAIESYTQALDMCPLCFVEEISIFYCNRAASHMKLEDYDSAISDCSKSLENNPKNLKALQRRACSYEKKEENYEKALEDYENLLKFDPQNKSAKKAVMRLPPLIAERNEKMKTEMMAKLKDLGNTFLRPFGLSTDSFKLEEQAGGGYSVKIEK